MRINQNISAMNTYSRLTGANAKKSGSLEKLSSGLRINRAGDDAAGLSISEKMRGQVGGLKQATRNAQDGISLIQTAEGALNESHSILNRMRDLAVQASNDTNTDEDRVEIQKEVNELIEELDRIADNTEFNTQNLLGGGEDDEGTSFTFHIGANNGQNITLEIASMRSDKIGAVEGDEGDEGDIESVNDLRVEEEEAGSGGVLTQEDADNAILAIDSAIADVSSQRSNLGSVQNRLEHTINNLTATAENLSAAESRIRDVDMAEEMMEFTKNNILSQAATSMLAQANQMPQSVLQLLQ